MGTVQKVAWFIVFFSFLGGLIALTAGKRDEFPGRRQGGGTHNTEQQQR